MTSQTSSEKAPREKAGAKKPPGEVRTPRLERGKARVAALMAAGAAVFAERGYDAATMTEVAAKAGASIGSLYQFFPTKAALATALHVEQLAILMQALDDLRLEAGGLTPGAVAELLFDRLSVFLDRHPAFGVVSERRDIEKPFKQATRERMLGQLTGLLTKSTPPVDAARAPALALLILALMQTAVTISKVDEPARTTVGAELRAMLKAHLDAAT